MVIRHTIPAIIVLTIFLFTSCQTTEQTTSPNNISESQPSKPAPFIPEWVDTGKSLQSDSTVFSVTAMATNVDSVKAMKMAKSQARSLLSVKLSELSEEQRSQLAENEPAAADAEFIFHLRKAEEFIAEGATFSKLEVKKDDNRSVAFAKIEVKRSAINTNLKRYFSDQPKYETLVDSFVFNQ